MQRRPRRRRRAWTLVKLAVGVPLGLLLIVLAAVTAFIGVECFSREARARRLPEEVARVTADVNGYGRDGAATYLTLPEWYIVYSTEEYASFIEQRRPSRFPYFRVILQFWRYYAGVCRVTRTAYPFDAGVHLMLGVVGASFSVESAVKGVYENTLGRAAEWIGYHHTEEDAFARRTAREYGKFMHTVPWYEFPFVDKLRALWKETPLRGPDPVRKWERKLALSAEYGAKAAYGWLIRRSTAAVYRAEALEIHAWVDGPPGVVFADRRVRKVKEVSARSHIVVLPRYEPFTEIVTALAKGSVRFRDIAGNDVIVVTAITPHGWQYTLERGDLLLAEEILTNPASQRIAVKAPVTSLHEILPALESRGATIEHLYDY